MQCHRKSEMSSEMSDLNSLLTSWNSWTPLHLAAFENNLKLVQAHSTFDELNRLDQNGRSPLQIAIENQHYETISLLVQYGASFEHVKINGLAGSRVFEHPDYFDLGIQLLPLVTMPLKFLYVLTSHACSTNQPDVMLKIIQNKAFKSSIFNDCDCMGLTPAHHAVLGGSLECVELLLGNGGLITKPSKTDLCYPIHYACSKGYADIFDVLFRVSSTSSVQSNVLNSQNVSGRTPFHLAMYNGHWEFVSSFSSCLNTCDPNIVDNNGHSVHGLLFQMRNNNMIPRQFQTAIPCLTTDEANWLLHNAISDQDKDLLCYALQQKADSNCFDLMQQTSLMHAAKLGCSESCLLLLENSADQTIRDWNGCTALHYSARNGNIDSTKTLLQFQGADCLSLSVDLCTPLDFALVGGHNDVVNELLQAMAKQTSSCHLPFWVKSLSLAVMSATGSILQEMSCYFPEKWITKLISNLSIQGQPQYNESTLGAHKSTSKSILKKYVPFLPVTEKITLRELKNRSKIKRKRMEQIETVRQYQPFKQVMRTGVKAKRIPPPFKVQTKETFYPVHQALYSRNKDAFMFLMREAHSAGLLEQFFMSKGPSDVSIAELVSTIFPEMITQWNIEEDVYECLLQVFTLDDTMPFSLALLHHIVSDNFIAKRNVSYSPLQRWSKWFLYQRLERYSRSLGIFGTISLDDIHGVTLLLDKVFESVGDPPFDDKDISLVLYCAVTNRIQMDLFERLLIGIGAGLDLSIPALHRKWPLTEAIRRGYYGLARLLLTYGDLQTCLLNSNNECLTEPVNLFSSDESPAELVNSLSSDDNLIPIYVADSTICDFKDKVMFSVHHISSADEFDFAMDMVKLFPNDVLERFLLSNNGMRLLYCCLSSDEASVLANFLLERYIFTLCQIVCEELGDKENRKRIKNIMCKLSQIAILISDTIYKHSEYKHRYNSSLELLNEFVSFCIMSHVLSMSYPIFYHLCQRGKSNIIRAILEYDLLESSNLIEVKKGFSPLYCIVAGGHYNILKDIMLKFPLSICTSPLYSLRNTAQFGALFYLAYSHRPNILTRKLGSHYNSVLHPQYLTLSDLHQSKNTSALNDFLELSFSRSSFSIDEESSDMFVILLSLIPNLSTVMGHLDESFVSDIFENQQKQLWFFSKRCYEIATHNFSDWLVQDLPGYNDHPSPIEFMSLLEKLLSKFPPFNPISIVRKGYHLTLERCVQRLDEFANLHKKYSVILKKWQLAVFDIIRRGHGELAIHILKVLNAIQLFQYVFDLKKLLAVAVKHKDSFNVNLLEYLLGFSPVTQVFISTVKIAAGRGNIEAINVLVSYNRPAVEAEITSILSFAAKSGQSLVLDYFYENQYSPHVTGETTDVFNHDTRFWITVFKNAVHYGHRDLALSAVGNMPFSVMTTLSSSANVLHDICWWGMADVLSTLCVDNSKLFFEYHSSEKSTPFQAALDNGHISKFSDIDCFPVFLDVASSDVKMLEKSMPGLDLTCRFSYGWLATAVTNRACSEEVYLFNQCKLSSTVLALPQRLSRLANVYFFMEALISPVGYNIVDSFIKTWGKQASGVLYYLYRKHEINVLDLAVCGGSFQTVQIILQILYDAKVINELTNPSIFQKALLKNDVRVLELLKMFCDSETVASLRREKTGETILHIVSEYSQSSECATMLLSIIGDNNIKKVVNSPDHANMNPLQCAITLGRFYVTQKLMSLTPFISDEEKKFLKRAFGWFQLLMTINANYLLDEELFTLLPTSAISNLPSIRLKPITAYYEIFKNLHYSIAESMMTASCGTLPLNGLNCSTSSPLDDSLVLRPSRQELIDFINSKEIIDWCRKGQFKSVMNIIKYILSSNENDLLETMDIDLVFVIACSSGCLYLVEYIIREAQTILPSTSTVAKSIIINGFVTAIGMGQLEIAAWIMLNGGITQGQLKQELFKACKPPFIVNLIFFSSARDICKILQNVAKQGSLSRVLIANVWMMHNWGKYQIQMINNRIRHDASLNISGQLELGIGSGKLVTVDVSSFPDIESVHCPFSKLAVVLSSCVSHFVTIWRCPSTISFKDIKEDTAVTVSCDLFNSLPRYDRTSYSCNIVLAFDFDQQTMASVFKWPTAMLSEENSFHTPNKENTNEITKLFSIPCEQLINLSTESCLRDTKDILVPIRLKCQSLVSSVTDCNQTLLYTLKQCINDVLCVLKLYRHKYSLYTELGIVTREFLEQFRYKQLHYKLFLKDIIDQVNIEVALGKSEVTAQLSSTRNLDIFITIDGNRTEIVSPTADQITRAVGSAIVQSEINYKYSNVLSHHLHDLPCPCTVAVYSFDEDSGVMTDLTHPSELSLQDVILLRFVYAIVKFVYLLTVTISSCLSNSSSDIGEIKLLLKLKNSKSYYDISTNSFSIFILDILPRRKKRVLSMVVRDFVQHAHKSRVCLTYPVAVTSYIDLNENFDFFSTLNDGYATICNIEGKKIDKIKLQCKRKPNTEHLYIASANVHKTLIQNSPLVFHFNDSLVREDPFTVQVGMDMILIVSHPGGGCWTNSKRRIVMNEKYTSIRDKVSPSKVPLKTTGTTNDYVHYSGVLYGMKEVVPRYTSFDVGIDVYLVASDECEDILVEIVEYIPMGNGVYQIIINSPKTFVGSVVAVCRHCDCSMRIHSRSGDSFLQTIQFK